MGIRSHGERSQCGAGSTHPLVSRHRRSFAGIVPAGRGFRSVNWLKKLRGISLFTTRRHPATHWLRSPVDCSLVVDALGSLSQWHSAPRSVIPLRTGSARPSIPRWWWAHSARSASGTRHPEASSRYALAPLAGRFLAGGGRTRLAQPVALGTPKRHPATHWLRSPVDSSLVVGTLGSLSQWHSAPRSVIPLRTGSARPSIPRWWWAHSARSASGTWHSAPRSVIPLRTGSARRLIAVGGGRTRLAQPVALGTPKRHPATHWLRSPVDCSLVADALGSLSQWHLAVHEAAASFPQGPFLALPRHTSFSGFPSTPMPIGWLCCLPSTVRVARR